MNSIYTFKNFLSINVNKTFIKRNIIIIFIKGIRASYPCRGIIFHSDKPRINKENLAIYLKREIALNIKGAESKSIFIIL
jgi:hypothetical protein